MAQEDAKKTAFVVYADCLEHLEMLSYEDRGKLFTALCVYVRDGEIMELDGAARMAFSYTKSQIDRDAEKYARTVKKRRESGKKGGRPPKATDATENQSEATETGENQEKANKTNGFYENQSEAKKPDPVPVPVPVPDPVPDPVPVPDTLANSKSTSPPTPPEGGEAVTAAAGAPETGDESPPPPTADPVPCKAIVDLYHQHCRSFPALRSITDARRRAIAARWREHGQSLDVFRELFEKAEASPFLRGRNDRNWRADFDWLLTARNMAKVLEGKYNDKGGGGDDAAHHSITRDASNTTSLAGWHMA